MKKGQAICHILPVQVEPLLQTTPEILDFSSNPALAEPVAAYREKRLALRNTLLEANQRGEDAPSWSKDYFQGKLDDGTTPIKHYQKIRMAEPVDRRVPPSPASPPGHGYKSGIPFDRTPRKK